MGRYVKMEEGRVVEDPPTDDMPAVKDELAYRRKVKRRKKNRWYRFRVRFLEALGLLLAVVVLGCIGAFFVFITVLTFAPRVGQP